MAISDKTYVGGTAGNNDLRATNDADGTHFNAGAGDDILRGGRYDDVLSGGAGNDMLFGGAGADQFRFFGNQISADGADTDRIFDLTFGDGDTLVFGSFSAGYFADGDGINAYSSDTAATISSWEGVVNLVANSGGDVTVSYYANNNNLLLTLNDGAISQSILITGGASEYNLALSA